jgi:hypothetical protein
MDKQQIVSFINENMFGIWFLIGAALVFWMQAGFAMVETGFTRAKNAGNILMKNLMDFCIGTVMFILIGFSLLLGEDVLGFIGKPGFDIFTSYANFDFSNFVFNLVFCATTATIVSGAMAERTKFLSYCIYSAVISAFIRLKHTGSGAAAGYHSLDSTILQVPVPFIWLAVFQHSSVQQCSDHVLESSQKISLGRLQKSTHSRDTIFHLDALDVLFSGLAGMDLMALHVLPVHSLPAYFLQRP